MNLFEEIFSAHCLVMVVSASMIIIACLVVLVGQLWLDGTLLISMSMCQILFICAMGTFFENSSEEFSRELQNVQWDDLEAKKRIYLLIMLNMSQAPPLNTIGSNWPSNLDSFMLVSLRCD